MQSTNDYRSRARQANPYAQQDDGPTSYQAAAVPSTTNLTAGGDSMTAFYSEVRPRAGLLCSCPAAPVVARLHGAFQDMGISAQRGNVGMLT